MALMEGLHKGVYVALFQADFTEENKERKLVFSVYCGQPIRNFHRVDLTYYPQESIDTFDDALQRLLETKWVGFEDEDY